MSESFPGPDDINRYRELSQRLLEPDVQPYGVAVELAAMADALSDDASVSLFLIWVQLCDAYEMNSSVDRRQYVQEAMRMFATDFLAVTDYARELGFLLARWKRRIESDEGLEWRGVLG